jgi:hypothetical protein
MHLGTLGQFIVKTYYYPKDLNHVYFCISKATLWDKRPNVAH